MHMRSSTFLAISGLSVYLLCGCSQSDTRKLTNDARATGEAVKQTTSDALDASKKAVDTAGDDVKRAADSDTAKDIKDKTKRGARRLQEKTKEAAHEIDDSLQKPAAGKPQ